VKIALVIPGRFHGFDLARSLTARGHDVRVLTNYPKSAVERFGLDRAQVSSFLRHGILARALARMPGGASQHEAWLHEMFGRWAARELAGSSYDIIHCWSGVSEELLRDPSVSAGCKLLMRGSAHIEVQSRLLEEEEVRVGVPLDRPSAWMRARERREYALADHILVLSTFSAKSFEEAGEGPARVSVVKLGVEVGAFRPAAEALEARCARVRSGAPLRVLYVGSLSYQKGVYDLAQVIEAAGERFSFTLVGPVLPEAAEVAARLGRRATVVGKVPQADLAAWYREADLFVFPTIQDGFAAVLAQARAAALPVITTANSAGTDIVNDGEDGWIVPIRNAGAIVERLRWCDAHRPELDVMLRHLSETYRPYDWPRAAEDFERGCLRLLTLSRGAAAHV